VNTQMKLEPVDQAVNRYMNDIKKEAKATGISLVQRTEKKGAMKAVAGKKESQHKVETPKNAPKGA